MWCLWRHAPLGFVLFNFDLGCFHMHQVGIHLINLVLGLSLARERPHGITSFDCRDQLQLILLSLSFSVPVFSSLTVTVPISDASNKSNFGFQAWLASSVWHIRTAFGPLWRFRTGNSHTWSSRSSAATELVSRAYKLMLLMWFLLTWQNLEPLWCFSKSSLPSRSAVSTQLAYAQVQD